MKEKIYCVIVVYDLAEATIYEHYRIDQGCCTPIEVKFPVFPTFFLVFGHLNTIYSTTTTERYTLLVTPQNYNHSNLIHLPVHQLKIFYKSQKIMKISHHNPGTSFNF